MLDRILYKYSVSEEPNSVLAPWMYDGDIIKPEVRETLLKIAEKIREMLPIPDMEWEDVWVVGSSLGYNYNEDSDIDLHFIVDLAKFSKKHDLDDIENARELLGYMFKYVNNRDLFEINGHKVELYWQDLNETNTTPAIYSLINDEFLLIPSKDTNFNENTLNQAKKRSKQLSQLLDTLIKTDNLEDVKEWKAVIKGLRKLGLEKDGFYSYGNLVFKFLRSDGAIEKANDYIDSSLG